MSDCERMRSQSQYPESIDRICESIREDQISISKLPFAGEQNARFRVTKSVESIMRDSQHDDNVEESLINLANNYMNK